MQVFRSGILLSGLILGTAPLAMAGSFAPNDLDGLVAWYRAETLHLKMRDGEEVGSWKDASGNGHHLTELGQGNPAVFRTLKLNKKPIVEISVKTSFSVENPFDLNGHTIVLVYNGPRSKQALLSSDKNDRLGVLLRDAGQFDQIQSGTDSWRYTTSTNAAQPWSITVLTRDGEELTAFVNGADVSTLTRSDRALRVGRLFNLRLTTAVVKDGADLKIAELIFYDRALTRAESGALTDHLAGKYAIEVEKIDPDPPPRRIDWSAVEILAEFRTSTTGNLNDDRAALAWKATKDPGAPFRVDPDHPTRIYCTKDESIVLLFVDLGLTAAAPGAILWVTALKNRTEYLEEEATTRVDADDAEGRHLTARFETRLHMNADEFFEIVTGRNGAEGSVTARTPECMLRLATE